ncbi:type III-A CRISPR-associated protein Cas10/Csm1 [Marinitoga arctica]
MIKINNINEEKMLSLSGLLHDIGKFMQRAEIENENNFDKKGFEEDKKLFAVFKNGYFSYIHAAYTAYFLDNFLNINNNELKSKIIDLSASHHKSKNNIISKADIYSASMDRIVDDENLDAEDLEKLEKIYGNKNTYKKIRQQSIFDKVHLYKKYDKGNINEKLKGKNKIELEKIDYETLEKIFPKFIESDELIPKEGNLLTDKYNYLWDEFLKEYKEISKIENFDTFYSQLSYLLQKYTSNIPSSTINYPDISLYDHLRTTAAIASCLSNKNNKFILLEGDISGIQKFIFKITDSEDKSKVAKRLRGRSFYIWLLTEVIAKYIIRYFDLTISNILYSGGGKFQIILPEKLNRNDEEIYVSKELKVLEYSINKWLSEKFDGLISIVFGILIEDFNILDKRTERSYSDLLYEMNNKLQEKKLQKYVNEIISEEEFFVNQKEKQEEIKKCKICGVKLKTNENSICKECQIHEGIGTHLAKGNKVIIFSKSDIKFDNEEIKNLVKIDFDEFGKVYIARNEKLEKNIIIKVMNDENLLDILKVNNTKNEKIKGFKFLGDTVPKAKEKISKEDFEDLEFEIEKGAPLTFEAISKLSIGDKKLGILKMDVDNLGMIFAMGFEKDNSNSEKSISRIASLSRNFDLFFGGYLNKICDKIFEIWKNEVKNLEDQKLMNIASKITNIFYITYSGGDDLFIVGPWDYTIELALEIRNELKRFTGYNPNIEISGGIAIVKNKYPISNAAEIAEENLEKSKNLSTQKGMINVFDTSLSWEEKEINGVKYKKFEDVLNKAKEYTKLVRNDSINRGLIYYIYMLNKEYCDKRKNVSPLYIPKLFYKVYRTTEKSLADKIIDDLIAKEYFKEFKFIGSYILEKTRGGM